MANMKEAVAAAARFVGELFPNSRNIRLEEIVAHGPVWHVVVSFDATEPTLTLLGGSPRTFKQIEVERDSGEPLALRMWKA